MVHLRIWELSSSALVFSWLSLVFFKVIPLALCFGKTFDICRLESISDLGLLLSFSPSLSPVLFEIKNHGYSSSSTIISSVCLFAPCWTKAQAATVLCAQIWLLRESWKSSFRQRLWLSSIIRTVSHWRMRSVTYSICVLDRWLLLPVFS